MKNKILKYSELDDGCIKIIRDALDSFIARTGEELSICEEAVSAVAFYRLQRHPVWGRNATTAQKNASYEHWKGRCYLCPDKVERAEAKFHHLIRGVKNQHGPDNLVPVHTSCHDKEHNVQNGSLSKKSP